MFATHPTWKTPLVIAIAGTALAGGLVLLACSGLSAAASTDPSGPTGGVDGLAGVLAGAAGTDAPLEAPGPGGDGSIDDENGIAVDADHAAIAGLAPELRAAVQAAAARAAEEGIELRVTSGWRSAELQETLLSDAIGQYGSESEARRWVDTPERSQHVVGDAVDIGGLEAALWVGQHGSEFGLCQTYANENWHFELAADADGVCPMPYADATDRP
ncbi:hypothetical protein D3248_03850 [Leucobacter zeae]|nr:hypothetical protein [Leucobacter zeae]